MHVRRIARGISSCLRWWGHNVLQEHLLRPKGRVEIQVGRWLRRSVSTLSLRFLPRPYTWLWLCLKTIRIASSVELCLETWFFKFDQFDSCEWNAFESFSNLVSEFDQFDSKAKRLCECCWIFFRILTIEVDQFDSKDLTSNADECFSISIGDSINSIRRAWLRMLANIFQILFQFDSKRFCFDGIKMRNWDN